MQAYLIKVHYGQQASNHYQRRLAEVAFGQHEATIIDPHFWAGAWETLAERLRREYPTCKPVKITYQEGAQVLRITGANGFELQLSLVKIGQAAKFPHL